MEQKFDINDPKIYLRNGSVLQCYPLAKTEDKPDRKRDNATADLFGKNVFLFLANSDIIFSDSRMFLADAGVHNGMAYGGAFRNGCLGAYLEWWIYNHRASIDEDGRPIWFLSGSPLSGSHVCLTADEEGERHRAKLPLGFIGTCKSFVGCCKDYYPAMANCQAFSIEEVVEKLQGRDSVAGKARIHTMLEYCKMDKEIHALQREVENWRNSHDSLNKRLQQVLFEKHHDALVEYHNKSLNLLTIAKIKDECFRERRIELRRKLRTGQITNKEYQQILMPLRKAKEDAEWEQRRFCDDRLGEILGEDKDRLSFYVVDRLIKGYGLCG